MDYLSGAVGLAQVYSAAESLNGLVLDVDSLGEIKAFTLGVTSDWFLNLSQDVFSCPENWHKHSASVISLL